jgi:membrane-associated phospholipid phosphatase
MSISAVPTYRPSGWNLKALCITHAVIILCLVTLFSEQTQPIWQSLDIAFFKTLNQSLNFGIAWQTFWAMANHKMADWVEDVVILGFCFFYVKAGKPSERLYRTSQMLFMIFFSALIIFFVNKIIIRDWVHIIRHSPTLVIESSIKLSDHISWLKIKDGSNRSFPGDHATTALLFGLTFVILGTRKMKILASLYAIFLCLPRMILGAHWLTDVMIGSGSIVFFFMMWAFCTPVAHKCTQYIERFLILCNKIKNIGKY